MDDDEPETEEFDAMLAERRGECDVALFFDVRLIHDAVPEQYIECLLVEAGASLQTSWAGYGEWVGAGYPYEALQRIYDAAAVVAKRFDFPALDQPLAIAFLDTILRKEVERCLPSVAQDPAFTGHADITFPSDMRTAIMRLIEWR